MNIFALSSNVEEIAKWQVDKHCIKMPLESAMMLSSAHRYLDGIETIIQSSKTGRMIKRYVFPQGDPRESILYGVSHLNHPSTVWTRLSRENYRWHFSLFLAMLEEYHYRYGKVHACTKLIDYLKLCPSNIPKSGDFTLPTPAMPDECIVLGDSIQSYRNYYKMKKGHLWSWSGKVNGRDKPEWISQVKLS
jgi:hypothetical protein